VLHHQLHAKKRFGQHFLHDGRIIDRILQAADLKEGDKILEIGPGPGALTAALRIARVQLVAIELDRDAAALLRSRWPDLTLVEQDALKADFSVICPGEGWQVIANLPYNVGTSILMRLLQEPARFSRLVLMFQKEVADRILAAPDSEACGALSIQVQARASVRRILDLGPGAFVPPPKVDSTVLLFEPFKKPDFGGSAQQFDKVVRAAFCMRRKTLLNALGSVFGREQAKQLCEQAGIDCKLRAEVLDLQAFRRLTSCIP
jgi:16S rRNA (adenine1518-N6/adenine1519-N6)-dimethyltransferase